MTRGPFAGVWTIVRLNWPYYAGAAVTAVLAAALLAVPSLFVKVSATLALIGCGWFLLGSLTAAYLIYDRSALYRFTWLDRFLPPTVGAHSVICHCGFDDMSSLLRAQRPPGEWTVLDHFQPTQMTEASIRRARSLYPPSAETQPAPHDRWPIESHSAKAIFGLLAIHELRNPPERAAWFTEAKRCLAPDGRIILAEHLRDGWNFLAFGPGFLHFHSAATWQRAWEQAGLRLVKEDCLTPFVRVFVLAPP